MSAKNRLKRLINQLIKRANSNTLTNEDKNTIATLSTEDRKTYDDARIKQKKAQRKKSPKYLEWKAQHKKIKEFYAQSQPQKKTKQPDPKRAYQQYMNQINAQYEFEDCDDGYYEKQPYQHSNTPAVAGPKNTFWWEYYMDAVETFKGYNRQKIYNLEKSDPLYTEAHHIKPKCIGGTNDPENFVIVSRAEHICLHALLFLSYPTCNSLFAAAAMMIAGYKKKKTQTEDKLFSEMFKQNPTQDDRKNYIQKELVRFVKKGVISIPLPILQPKEKALHLVSDESDTGVNFY